jgi:hypothetical protein
LYFDEKNNKWTTFDDYYEEEGSVDRWEYLIQTLYITRPWIIVVAVILILSVISTIINLKSRKELNKRLEEQWNSSREITERSLSLSERCVELGEEGNLLLKDILEELKRKSN